MRRQDRRRWSAGNLVRQVQAVSSVKPDKARSAEKIDLMVAGIMALDRAIRHAQPQRDDYAAAGF